MMKSETKSVLRFFAVLLALLSVGMHFNMMLIPMLGTYKFGMLLSGFILLLVTILF